MTDRVTVDVHDHIAIVTLNRPEKMNALDADMFAGIVAATDEVAANNAVRAVVLTAAGDNFCAGLDVSNFSGGGMDVLTERMTPPDGKDANYFQQPAIGLRDLPVPVIAALRGVVFGGGLQVAMGADIRIAAPDVRLSIMEIKWGLIPDMGLAVTARDQIPLDHLKRLTLTGDIITSAEAARCGVVTELAEDPVAAATQLAERMASRSPDAIRAGKAMLSQVFTSDRRSALSLEASTQLKIIGRPNQLEAMAAGLEKRDPKFS